MLWSKRGAPTLNFSLSKIKKISNVQNFTFNLVSLNAKSIFCKLQPNVWGLTYDHFISVIITNVQKVSLRIFIRSQKEESSRFMCGKMTEIFASKEWFFLFKTILCAKNLGNCFVNVWCFLLSVDQGWACWP